MSIYFNTRDRALILQQFFFSTLHIFVFSLGHRLTEHTVLRTTNLEVYEMDTVGLLTLFEVRNSVNHGLFGVICEEASFS